jgi:cytochrome b-561
MFRNGEAKNGEAGESCPSEVMATNATSNRSFFAIYVVANATGLIFLGLITHWLKEHSGGLKSWNKNMSNFHPYFMTFFLFLYGNGMLTYRLMKMSPKKYLKIAHALINGTAGSFALTAMSIKFWQRNKDPSSPHLYSLHSWIGFATIVLYEINFLVGLISFLVPSTPQWIRAKVLPFHVFAGHALLAMIVTSLYSGVVEMMQWTNLGGKYSQLPHLALVINFYGLFVLIFALITGYLVSNTAFKRQPLPTD